MCLILTAWRLDAAHPMVVAANRDEFHARPAAPAAFWEDQPAILAGRDLEARGTWMGVSRGGKFCAVTNYRGAREPRAAESRGALVSRFLSNGDTAADYMGAVQAKAQSYSGFNLLACDGQELWWMSNRGGEPRRLDPGLYGLGNTLLDAPEVDEPKARFAAVATAAPATETLFGVLAASRIVNPLYGTRCATILLRGPDSLRYAERSLGAEGEERDTVQFELRLA
jgi:uncharacterized protein with NRDE domain